MKKINVEKTIENIDRRYADILFKYKKRYPFIPSWIKEDNGDYWYIFTSRFEIKYKTYEFGFSKDGKILEGNLTKEEVIKHYSDCIVYKEDINDQE